MMLKFLPALGDGLSKEDAIQNYHTFRLVLIIFAFLLATGKVASMIDDKMRINLKTILSKRPLEECSKILEEAKTIFGFDENYKLAYSKLFCQSFQHEVSH